MKPLYTEIFTLKISGTQKKTIGSKKPEFLFLYLYRKAKRFKDKQKATKAL